MGRTLLISCLLMTISIYAEELKCQKWPISYIYGKEKIQEEQFFCFNLHSNEACSKKCNRKKECPLYNKLYHLADQEIKKKIETVGTRGFQLCYQLGGRPSIFKIKISKGERTMNRCQLGDEFVDLVTLQRWEKEIKKQLATN